MSKHFVDQIDQFVMKTYGRTQLGFVKGDGCKLWDADGKQYLDFLSGIAVCQLGHAHPGITQAVCAQAGKLTHVSNIFYTEPQARVAELLVEHSFASRVFFCNSGAEANEGAIKLARLWGHVKLNGAKRIIAADKSFHGRTLATLSATGQAKIQEGFAPLLDQFSHVPYGDLAAARDAVADDVCAILVEPVQGEGGVVVPPADYFAGLKELCREKGILLMFDEVQTGMGRTGKMWGYQNSGVEPDVATVAKGLANGLPAGAVLASESVAELFGPGKHGTTFGAGPVIMEAARVTLETITAPGFLEGVNRTGLYFRAKLEDLAGQFPRLVKEVRGVGLILGLQLTIPGAPLLARLLEKGFVANCTQETVLRFLPPLIITEQDIDQLARALAEVLQEARA